MEPTFRVTEGIVLQTEIDTVRCSVYCTHGHQGDTQSDGNWFSKFFVSDIWGPLQAWLRINPNTPSTNDSLKTVHNRMMYEWSASQEKMLLITGHTHQPVFESMTHIEIIYQKLSLAQKNNNQALIHTLQDEVNKHHFKSIQTEDYKPSYFNSGCCCFDDGDITGIEISEGMIRLIKWDKKKDGKPERFVLEESDLKNLFLRINK